MQSLLEGVAALSDAKVKTRSDALEELEHFVLNDENVTSITDKQYLELTKSTIKGSQLERNHAEKGTSGGASAEARMQRFGEALRKLAEKRAPIMRSKAASLLLLHAASEGSHLVRNPRQGYYSGTAIQYARLCLAISEHEANLEHILSQDWWKLLLSATTWLSCCLPRAEGSAAGRTRSIGTARLHPSTPALSKFLCNVMAHFRYDEARSIVTSVADALTWVLNGAVAETSSHASLFECACWVLYHHDYLERHTAIKLIAQGYRFAQFVSSSRNAEFRAQVASFLALSYHSINLAESWLVEKDTENEILPHNSVTESFDWVIKSLKEPSSRIRLSDVNFRAVRTPEQHVVSWLHYPLFNCAAGADPLPWSLVTAARRLAKLGECFSLRQAGHATKRRRLSAAGQLRTLPSKLAETARETSSTDLELTEVYLQILATVLQTEETADCPSVLASLTGICARSSSSESCLGWVLVCAGCLFSRALSPLSTTDATKLWKVALHRIQDDSAISSAASFCLASIVEYLERSLSGDHREMDGGTSLSLSDDMDPAFIISLFDENLPVLSSGALALFRSLADTAPGRSDLAAESSRLLKWILTIWSIGKRSYSRKLDANVTLLRDLIILVRLLCGRATPLDFYPMYVGSVAENSYKEPSHALFAEKFVQLPVSETAITTFDGSTAVVEERCVDLLDRIVSSTDEVSSLQKLFVLITGIGLSAGSDSGDVSSTNLLNKLASVASMLQLGTIYEQEYQLFLHSCEVLEWTARIRPRINHTALCTLARCLADQLSGMSTSASLPHTMLRFKTSIAARMRTVTYALRYLAEDPDDGELHERILLPDADAEEFLSIFPEVKRRLSAHYASAASDETDRSTLSASPNLVSATQTYRMLLRFVGSNILANYTWQRSEVALSVIIHVLDLRRHFCDRESCDPVCVQEYDALTEDWSDLFSWVSSFLHGSNGVRSGTSTAADDIMISYLGLILQLSRDGRKKEAQEAVSNVLKSGGADACILYLDYFKQLRNSLQDSPLEQTLGHIVLGSFEGLRDAKYGVADLALARCHSYAILCVATGGEGAQAHLLCRWAVLADDVSGSFSFVQEDYRALSRALLPGTAAEHELGTALMKRSAREISLLWIEKARSLKQFPYHVFGFDNQFEFVQECHDQLVISSILAMLIFQTPEASDSVDLLKSVGGRSIDELMELAEPSLYVFDVLPKGQVTYDRSAIDPAHVVMEAITSSVPPNELWFESSSSLSLANFSVIPFTRESENQITPEVACDKITRYVSSAGDSFWSDVNLSYILRSILLESGSCVLSPESRYGTMRKALLTVWLAGGMRALSGYALEILLKSLMEMLFDLELAFAAEQIVGILTALFEHSLSQFVTQEYREALLQSVTLDAIAGYSGACQIDLTAHACALRWLNDHCNDTTSWLLQSVLGLKQTWKADEVCSLFGDARKMSSHQVEQVVTIWSHLIDTDRIQFTDAMTPAGLADVASLFASLPKNMIYSSSNKVKEWIAELLGTDFLRGGHAPIQMHLKGRPDDWSSFLTSSLEDKESPDTLAMISVLEFCYLSGDLITVYQAERYLRALGERAMDELLSHLREYDAMWSKKALEIYFSGNAYHYEQNNGMEQSNLSDVRTESITTFMTDICNHLSSVLYRCGCSWAGKPLTTFLHELPAILEPVMYALLLSAFKIRRELVWEIISSERLWAPSVNDQIKLRLARAYLLLKGVGSKVTSAGKTSQRRLPQLFITDTSSLERAMSDVCANCGLANEALLLLEYSWDGYQARIDDDRLATIGKIVADPDLFYGSRPVPSLQIAASASSESGNIWDQIGYQAAVFDNLQSNAPQLASTLMAAGVYGLSQSLLTKTYGENPESRYAAAWKLQQWSVPESQTARRSKHGLLFATLKNLRRAHTDAQWTRIIADARYKALENYMSRKRDTSLLGILQEIDEIRTHVFGHSQLSFEDAMTNFKRRIALWSESEAASSIDDCLTAREVCWSIGHDVAASNLARPHGSRNLECLENNVVLNGDTHDEGGDTHQHQNTLLNAKRGHIRSLLLHCRYARKSREVQRAMAGTVRLRSLADEPLSAEEVALKRIATTIEEAAVAWELGGNSSIAVSMLRRSALEPMFYKSNPYFSPPEVLALIGHWSHKARHDSPAQILEAYMNKAVDTMRGETIDSEVCGKVYHLFAAFCDDTGHDSLRQERTDQLERQNASREEEVKDLTNMIRTARTKEAKEEAMSHLNKITRVLRQDSEELSRLKAEQANAMRTALEYYVRGLAASDEFPQDVGRFVAIWLEYSEQSSVIGSIGPFLEGIPSHKMVEWAPQLISRLVTCDSLKDTFSKQLLSLVVGICADHPFQTVYMVINHQVVPRNSGDESLKARIAVEIAKRVRASGVNELVRKMTSFAERLVDLSTVSVKNRTALTFDSSKVDRTWWMKTLPTLNLPPPVLTVPIRSDRAYDTVTTIVAVNREMEIASGLSAPKVVSLRLSDGKVFKMLVKGGNDDLRQDQVMEHMFGQVNGFLQRHEKTRQRKLKVRTYNVQPLGPACGIIEFVSHTKSLIDVLSSVHSDPLSISKGKEMMRHVQQDSYAKRLDTFKQITDKIKPSLRHFFWYTARDTEGWLTMRTAYSRSTAAISMVGHIIGLGDRHCSNIILDVRTGEVVHIDLGIAFDQLLRIPETVPFRLTRDIVDGMGIMGTEGVFQRCCEFTLTVLRQEADHLMTSLNVLKYDPLYTWELSKVKKNRAQAVADATALPTTKRDHSAAYLQGGAGVADRALTIVRKKLSADLSPEATVRGLIQEASDPANLAVIFFGWCPFL